MCHMMIVRVGLRLTPGDNEDLSTSARRKKVDTSVTWLKKTVYLTNDPFDPVHQFKSEQQAQVLTGWIVVLLFYLE